MRLYLIVIDDKTVTERAPNASIAIWQAIESYVARYNKQPNNEPYTIGYYTKKATFVPLIDGQRKENSL